MSGLTALRHEIVKGQLPVVVDWIAGEAIELEAKQLEENLVATVNRCSTLLDEVRATRRLLEAATRRAELAEGRLVDVERELARARRELATLSDHG